MKVFFGFFVWVFVSFCSAMVSAQSSDFITANIYVDNVRAPKNVLDIARDCSNNPACVAIFKAADNYFQVPASKVVSIAATLAPKSVDEGTYVFAKLPPDYTYCKSTMHMVSIVPHDGPRGSTFMGQSRDDGLYYETWTPKQPIGGGRSWVEAGISILGVRRELASEFYASGKCYSPQRVLWYCRGGGCKSTDDIGQAKSNVTPGAMSAN